MKEERCLRFVARAAGSRIRLFKELVDEIGVEPGDLIVASDALSQREYAPTSNANKVVPQNLNCNFLMDGTTIPALSPTYF
jgi:hypothetical protein